MAAPSGPVDKRAPVIEPRGAQIVPGKYIVKLKAGVSDTALTAAMGNLKTKAEHVYKTSFKGFAGAIDDATLDILRGLDAVEYIEKEGVFTTQAYVSQTGAPWGLGRISHRARGSTTYQYDNSAGAGVCAYVIDTGILTTHTQFGGRATWLANYAGDGSNTDGNGHGTHVAGILAGSTYGVAKSASLFAVKVLDASGSGSTSGVIAGINFVTSDVATRNCPNGTVANLSLGGGFSATTNTAARNLVSAGTFLAVAAGNSNVDASSTSPASEATVCTVGATTSLDARASYSNYGSVVDIFAPGTNVLSSWNGGNSATNTISGTSMASPHIAGLGAYLLTLLGRRTPAALCSYIQSTSLTGLLTGVPSGTSNRLAFNGNPSG
ncbi:peptidase S8/S53 domain-containing protein [Bombardia bombarda]|uniref:Peptidase S8/S53 domain-containing protein n=1 Tax=Bombardia bombarda TaxID=252184 RepID=A0AA39X9Y3_9PEZI|nr:peptidase S8/S53 domain-containing protein [Bombardia bombarda]